MKKPDIISGILGIVLSVYVYAETSKFPEDRVLLMGPSYFPRILAIALMILSIGLIINALLGKSEKSEDKFDIKDPGIQRSAIALLATLIYAGTLKHLGFIISSILYLIFLMYLLKNRSYLKMFVVSIAVTFTIYAIFRIGLNITLPSGLLG